MRPKLKGDTYYFPTADGVYLRNNHESFYLKGKGLARLLDILGPYLNGAHTLDEIAANLPADRQELVRKLVQTLTTKGFILDVSTDLPHQLSERELRAYEAEIAFVEAFTPSAPSHFEQYRNARVLLIGSGLTLTALVHAALHSGLRQVHVLLTDECVTDRQRLLDYLELYRERDGHQEVYTAAPPDWTDEEAVRQALQPFDALLHLTDRTMTGRARLLSRLAYEQQKILIQAVVVGERAWIGPLARPGKPGCWECAWRRLQANFPEAHTFEDFPSAEVSRFVAAPTAAVVANLLHFELFKYLTGVEALETVEHMLAIDLETLQSKRHAFVPHPFCSTCSSPAPTGAAAFEEDIECLRAAPAIEQERFSSEAARLFDTHFGLFQEIDEHDCTQIPLNLSQVTFALPQVASLLTVTGQGTDFGMARRSATRQSCEIYAAHFYDARHVLSAQETRALLAQGAESAPRVYNRRLHLVNLSTAEANSQEGYLWAWDLLAQRPVLVDASVAFPPFQEAGLSRAHDLIGVGSGLSWDEAIYRALLDHMQVQALRACAQIQTAFPQVNLAEAALLPAGERYRELLKLARAELAIYDLSACSWGFPCFAFCLGGATVAYSSDCDAAEALRTGLELTLLAQQGRGDSQNYVPEVVYDLPLALRGSEQIALASESVLTLEERNRRLLAAFQEHGFAPLAIPLNHDPELARVLPFLLRVVLGEALPERSE